jgi:hypothetical protein
VSVESLIEASDDLKETTIAIDMIKVSRALDGGDINKRCVSLNDIWWFPSSFFQSVRYPISSRDYQPDRPERTP